MILVPPKQQKQMMTPTFIESHKQPRPRKYLQRFVTNKKGQTAKSFSTALIHLNNFITKEYAYNYNYDSVIEGLKEGKVNIYELLDSFVSYIQSTKPDISPKSVSAYMIALRSYFTYYDIDIVPSKFKNKVMLPRILRQDEEPIDSTDIRRILNGCTNKRLKTYLLLLASSGCRANEALAIRRKDIDFSSNPTKIHLRPEDTKTGRARDIYVSDEATQNLKEWLEYKEQWNDRNLNPKKPNIQPKVFTETDLVFSQSQDTTPHIIYFKILTAFQKLLTSVGMDQRKETGSRRLITLHSFRRHAKTVISTQVNTDYSEFFLGHSKSPYWTMKEPERREIYATKIMKYLTFLDYSALESTGKNIEARLLEKENEIEILKARLKQTEVKVDGLGLDELKATIRNIQQELGLATNELTQNNQTLRKLVK